MKVSTLTAIALLAASPFAPSNHTTALDGLVGRAAFNAAPVAAPVPGAPAGVSAEHEHWMRIELPKAHGLAGRFTARAPRAKT
ncbi:hypothetical protein WKR88_07005 [Trinickia caryophylli]|uniref:Uncharacterized protein n=1 Tax=Trinickia caryophylli TaxID=28094 RepID=A0A1X7FY13_TRICW|nr:hypothetical protein [Trinickia caryophylli]PMS11676.1 hypothetical protein C0Z17_12605 [Trinickia caryophylli]TRX17355.1 hypothetical protein FNF07_03295 [Trinickia caryophylli]WQE11905.1 hypothetical protein U0034_00275 [Trinickia caryophylli]SMF60806.1 hypothetical protein SAMN06295900_112170 [Trinickia caryophylli]GLU34586.1 hypothetical protein Busp01_44280 [Trinickia caryophylli]